MTMMTMMMLTALIVVFTPLRGPAETILSVSVVTFCATILGLLMILFLGLIFLIVLGVHIVLMLASAVKTAALKNLNRSRTDVR